MDSAAIDRHEADLARLVAPGNVVDSHAGAPVPHRARAIRRSHFAAEFALIVGPFVLKFRGREHVLGVDDQQEVIVGL